MRVKKTLKKNAARKGGVRQGKEGRPPEPRERGSGET
jgi:hypothetical protein